MAKKQLTPGKRRAQRTDGMERTVPMRSHNQPKAKDPVTKALKADFDSTHSTAMRALRKRDFEAVGRAIDRERELIDEQKAHIARGRAKQATRGK